MNEKKRYTERLYVRCTPRVKERVTRYRKEHRVTLCEAIDQLLDTEQHDTIIEVVMDNSRKRMGRPNAGKMAANDAIHRIMDSNNRIVRSYPGQRKAELVYISRSAIKRLFKVDFPSLNRYWKENEKDIVRHNFATGFQDENDGKQHNTKYTKTHAKLWSTNGKE